MSVKKYSESHEWVEVLEDGTALIGLSEHAVEELGDIVFVNLGEVGDAVTAGETFGDIESVKAVSDLVAPVSGVIEEINEALLDAPELINEAPLDTWLIKLSAVEEVDELMDEGAYLAFIEE